MYLIDRVNSNETRARGFVHASCCMGLLLSSTAALAQSGEATGEAVMGGLEEVVVTARKRTESVQNAPVAVTVLSGEQLSRYSITSLEQVAAVVPQLQISRAVSGSQASISMRGIGSTFSSAGIESSVPVIVDGVYYGFGQVLNEGLFDSSQIEILKGPQALFFGKNATAGVISVTTADPTDTFEVMTRVGYEFEAENASVDGYISGPLTDTLSARLAVRFSEMSGGYYENGGGLSEYTVFDAATGTGSVLAAPPAENWSPQEEQAMARLTLEWRPSENLTARLKVAGNRNDANDPAWNTVPICAGDTMQIAPTQTCNDDFIRYANNAPPALAAGVPEGREDGSLFNRYRSYSYTGLVEYDVDRVDLTAVANYNSIENASMASYHGESPFVGIGGGGWGSEISDRHAFSVEVRALSKFDSPFNLMTGIYYQDSSFNYDAGVGFAGVANSAAPATEYVANLKTSYTDGETIAGYGQLIWNATPTLEINAGVRYTHETKNSFLIQTYSNPLLIPFIYIPNVPVTADQSWDDWSPELVATWRPSENVTVYGGYKTGYKSGGFNNSGILGQFTPPGGLEFEPETVSGFEGGVKTTLFDNQLRFNIGAYYYEYEDLQLDFWNTAIFTFITMNAGSAETKGIEIETQWSPLGVPGFDVHGALNYNEARYKNHQGPCWTGQTIQEGCSLFGPGGAFFQDLSGRPTANAPEWTASLGSGYNFALGDKLEGRLSVDARYSDRYNFSTVYDPIAFQSSYIVLDAAASLATADNRWELAIVGKNLTNERYIGTTWETTNTGGGTGTTVGFKSDILGFANIPRTVELRLTWRY